jgi:16S rRNA pseudouridine516 synthase
MGSLKLDEELKLGEYRRLTKAELQELKEHRR